MAGRGSGARHVLFVVIALAFGLVLMHGGLDPAVSGGHHLGADRHPPTAAPAEGHGGDHGEHDPLGTLAGICAVFALVAVAFVVRRPRAGGAPLSDVSGRRPHVDALASWEASSPPRVSLCVERC